MNSIRRNLKKARVTWGVVSMILTWQEVPVPVSGMCYQAVMLAVLLYGSTSWNLLPSGMQLLEGFHVEVTHRLTGMYPQRQTTRPWIYPTFKEVLHVA